MGIIRLRKMGTYCAPKMPVMPASVTPGTDSTTVGIVGLKYMTKGGDVMAEENKVIELTSVRAMIYVPENAVDGELTFTIYQNGELQKVSQTMDMNELREAIRKAEEGYIDEDDRFVLTDEGRRYMEEMMKRQEAGWPADTYEG